MDKTELNINEYKIKILRFLSDNRMCIDDLKTYTMEDYYDIAKWIYIVLWCDLTDNKYSLPNLIDVTSFDFGDNKYGGDTMNPIKESNYYLTIGNFMILPKGKAFNKYTTLNRYRNKGSGYNDDFLKFLQQIDNMYKLNLHKKNTNKIDSNNIWEQLFVANQSYFNYFPDFSSFINKNLLNDWKLLEENKKEKFVEKRAERICAILKERLKS